MNGNPVYHAAVLAALTVVMLPLVWATATGRLQRGSQPDDPVGRRRRAWGLVALWSPAPLNALPRITGAGPVTVTACTAAAGLLVLAGLAVAARGFRAARLNGAL